MENLDLPYPKMIDVAVPTNMQDGPNCALSIDFALKPKRDGESLDCRGCIAFKLCDWWMGNYIANEHASLLSCYNLHQAFSFGLVYGDVMWCVELAACSCFQENFPVLCRRRKPRKRYL
jgi:hypothetical protein